MFRRRKAASPIPPRISGRFLCGMLIGGMAVTGCLRTPWLSWHASMPLLTVTAEHALATLDGDQFATSWSPDGTQMALMRNLGGAWNVWTMRLDGTQLRQLTHESRRDDAAAWSPDGRRLVFSSDRVNRVWPDLWLLDLNHPDAPERLTPGHGKYFHPAWSPDGTQVAYIYLPTGPAYYELRTISVTGRVIRVLSTEGVMFSPPAWSPDGKRIVFVSDRTGNAELWTVDLSLTGPDGLPPAAAFRQLTHHPGVDKDPTWSPDGRFLAFTSTRSGNKEIWVMEVPDTSLPPPNHEPAALQQLTHDHADDEYPIWDPDGSKLVFASNRSGHEEPWVIELHPSTGMGKAKPSASYSN